MRAGSAGRGGVRGEKGGGRWAFAQGANRCVYVPLQDTDNKRSALHYAAAAGYASSSGLESIVAKLLSLGADAALIDEVRAYCSYTNTSEGYGYSCLSSLSLIRSVYVHVLMYACRVHVYAQMERWIETGTRSFHTDKHV